MTLKQIDGLPIINAKRTIKVTVNKNDIGKSDPKNPADCAVARAIRREFHVKEARVHLGRVYLRANEGNWVRYFTPRALRTEIIAFDRGGTFSPGEYTLSPMSPSKAQGKHQGGPTKQQKKTGKKRSPPHVVTDVRSGVA